MRFGKFRRWAHRLFDRSHNEFALGAGTVCEIPSGTDMTETTVRIHGDSKLIVESGASIHQVSFQIDSGSTVRIGAGVVLTDADICIWNQSELTIGKDCRLNHVSFSVEKGKIALSDDNVLSSGGRADKARIAVSDGSFSVGDHNHLQNSCWIRFGGRLAIGRYNCINAGSELRCDESVTIGSFNMISYNCDIWDTNTHCFYPLEEKKEMFVKDFPAIGRERSKPGSRPVVIGDGNWIGKNACVLKGSILGNETVVGTRAIVSNMTVEDGAKVVPAKSESMK